MKGSAAPVCARRCIAPDERIKCKYLGMVSASPPSSPLARKDQAIGQTQQIMGENQLQREGTFSGRVRVGVGTKKSQFAW